MKKINNCSEKRCFNIWAENIFLVFVASHGNCDSWSKQSGTNNHGSNGSIRLWHNWCVGSQFNIGIIFGISNVRPAVCVLVVISVVVYVLVWCVVVRVWWVVWNILVAWWCGVRVVDISYWVVNNWCAINMNYCWVINCWVIDSCCMITNWCTIYGLVF